ncbi:transcriptional regulator, TetR family [Butyrivibrio proteoclasticus]|uniref:Transcriptional regulator, TetR family n=1 Tax=Butyrivibrio proteoclasticus TaxID=43305 RepID=A0A1I5T9C3_9FIRM|nr:TetR/AcrR family transcriptional regulator [Butyrivibrio proteoclasticus]SFP79247.1 transcriptional regulator, TetR family [Butyrivibrio proteoclasticus]
MPKIIENLKEQIIAEAKRQLFENGYSKTTIRSVATACGIGVGTMYNYFQSKDMLISSFMLEDWIACTLQMKKLDTSDALIFIEGIHDYLKVFIDKYSFLFKDKDAASVYSAVFTERHAQLRGVLAGIIMPVCTGEKYDDPDFMAGHIAESLLFWTLEDVPFEKQAGIFRILLN